MLPILAELGPVTLYTHDVFTVGGLLAGLVLYYRALRRDRVLDLRIVLISVAGLVGGALGARLITSWEILDEVSAANLPLTYVVTHGPRSIIGGLAGGFLAIVLSKRALGYTLSTGDYYAAAIPLALLVGRVGCFLSELPLGTPTDLPWGMTVTPDAAAGFPRCPGCDGPMHPSMLYEVGFHALAFGLIATRGPLLPVRGDTLKAYLLGYGVFRFGVEFVRGNEVQALGLTGPQLVLIPLIGLLVVHFLRRISVGAYRVPAPQAVSGAGADR
ncbi:MAG TPA: prolipoprotein diacylglyceryl transferase family protein [Candidatus Limnocylindria bacterium]|nr:prolipoprotein diacylglyceryl transferase family protein [Candidatus Limnocylindria bacterium]